jgi:iron(III) transport system substrate-binding protein
MRQAAWPKQGLARGLALGLAVVLPAIASAELAPEDRRSHGAPDAEAHLLVRGTTDVELFDHVLAAFVSQEPGLRVDYEQWASNDLYLSGEAACRGTFPSADLTISSSVDQHIRLVNDGCAQPHRSEQTASLPPAQNWRNEIFGLTREPAVMVYNRDLVPQADVPKSRFDLLDLLRRPNSRFAGRIATYDIEASGLGYLFAFADSQQATTFGSLIEAFGRTGAIATCCSGEILDGVASGEYLIAYNVLGSYALARASEDPRIAVVAPEDYVLVLSRAALIPLKARNPAAAGRLLDFLLSPEGQWVLTDAHLVLDVAELLPDADDAVLRPIPLSPVLLVGLDREKRRQFLDIWKATFPPAP